MKEIVLGIWLGIQGVIDWKYKEIPLWIFLLGGVIGVCFCVSEGREIVDILIACMPGSILLIVSRLTKEIIGYGDDIVFVVMGLYMSFEKLISIGILAYMIAGVVALFMLVVLRKNGNYRIAFLPFLGISYLINWWIEQGGAG